MRASGSKLLEAANKGDVDTVRELLAARTVDVDARDENAFPGNMSCQFRFTALRLAVAGRHAPFVKLLLKAGATVDAVNKDRNTALHLAALSGNAAVVELLLQAGAAVDAVNKNRSTALHRAAWGGDAPVVELLLKAGATVDATDKYGKTPLHGAYALHMTGNTCALLLANANVDAKDRVRFYRQNKSRMQDSRLFAYQTLIYSVPLDQQDGLAPLHHLLTARRNRELDTVVLPTLQVLVMVMLRLRICLVGPSCAGKSSFVMSIATSEPQLEHNDTRTIGIDHIPLRFEQDVSSREKSKIHEVMFWDFAGQDAYQVGHSLFFSPRTLYFVFVDLQAFTIAYKQAVIFADDESQEPKLLDEFFERSVRQWMRLIVARHRGADFVFIATKEDLLLENEYLRSELKEELRRRLQGVLTEVQAMKAVVKDELVPSIQDSRGNMEPTIVYVSCSSKTSVLAARNETKEIIIKSRISFPMTDEYSNVLNAITTIRNEARERSVSQRIKRTFAPEDDLLAELAAIQDDEVQLRNILLTLHDLGDVLWYESLNIHRLRVTIILDPPLLIDFIRQIITHEHTGVKMSHADLKAKPFWRNLRDDKKLTKAMKQLMQRFHLVYSDAEDRVMEWDPHLIVPAYWKTREPAARRFPSGGFLNTQNVSSEGDHPPRVRVRWDYHFESGLPSTVFDHFVVASVSPLFHFDSGPDWLLYEGGSGFTAYRVMIGRDGRSLHRTIHVEAVVADAASPAHESDLWGHFRQFVRALMLILREHNGLSVSCNAWDDAGRELELKGLLNLKAPPERPTWMPPVAMWASLRL